MRSADRLRRVRSNASVLRIDRLHVIQPSDRRASCRGPRRSAHRVAQSRFRCPVLTLDEQERIASVLGALDDKIDSNRRLAALLEETAATVFRARFVDFVGVEEFDDSEIGRMPRVGASAPLGDAAAFVDGALRAHRADRLSGSDSSTVGDSAVDHGAPADVIDERRTSAPSVSSDTAMLLSRNGRAFVARESGGTAIGGHVAFNQEILVLRAASADVLATFVLCRGCSRGVS